MRSTYARDLKEAEARFARHQTSDRRARCFDFRDPKMGSFYAFSLSWTPGTLTLAGDLGELVVTHYHALWELEAGLSWAAGSDYDYLLGKTKRRPSYDREATVHEIVRMANEAALESLGATRTELRSWRGERPARAAFPEGSHGDEDHAEEVRCWRDERPDVAGYLSFRKARAFGRPHWEEFEDRDVAPDGWQLWHRLHEEFGWGGDPSRIFRPSWRRSLRNRLNEHLDEVGQERAAELCMRLHLDDYYGGYGWTHHDLTQIAAVKWGAKRALQWLEGERVYAWHDALPPLQLSEAA